MGMTSDQYLDLKELWHDDEGRMLLRGRPFTGIAVDYWPNGTKASEVSYENGVQHGLLKGWYQNGAQLSETMYVYGCAEGISREWYENGQLKRQETIGSDGYVTAFSEWDEVGRLVRSRP